MRYVLSSLIVKVVYKTSLSNCVYNEVKWGRSYHFDLSVFYCMSIWNQDIIYKVPYLSSIFFFQIHPFFLSSICLCCLYSIISGDVSIYVHKLDGCNYYQYYLSFKFLKYIIHVSCVNSLSFSALSYLSQRLAVLGLYLSQNSYFLCISLHK